MDNMRRSTFWGLSGLAVLLAYLYYPVMRGLVAQWSIDTTFGYGFFIPWVAAYLMWDRRREFAAITPQPSWWGYLVLVAGLAALVIGRVGGIALVERGSLLIVLFGLFLFLGGWRMSRCAAFPLAFLALMIPVPLGILGMLTWPLQLLTARFATEVLQLLGYPVFLQGIYIDLPAVRLEVADACSGFHSILSLGATGVLLAYITQERGSNRILLVASVVPIAIASNLIRVTSNILLGMYEGEFHLVSGLVVFGVATTFLIGVALLLARSSARVRNEPVETAL
jgi:exosortase